MPASLILGQAAPKESLSLSVQVDGQLEDAYEVTFTVYNEDSLPGTSVLTGTVTTGAGKFATGRYSVYNTGLAALWTPAAAIGRGRVVWLYRLEAGGEQYRVDRLFEVVANTVGARYAPVYNLLADSSAYGSRLATERQLRELNIEIADVIDRYCKQRFRLTMETKRFKGSGSRMLHFGEPLWALASARRNAGTEDDDLDDYEIYGSSGTDRRNSKIVFTSTSQQSIFVPVDRRFAEFAGGLTQTFTGLWGFVDEDQDAPSMIRRAAAICAFRAAEAYDGVGPTGSTPGGPIAKEETDQHSISYAISSGKSRGGMLSILKSPEVRDALDVHMAPISISVPANQTRTY